MKKNIFKICFIFVLLFFASCNNEPKVTFDPYEDAQTYIELLEEEDTRISVYYLQNVQTSYTNKGLHDELNKFTSIAAEEMAKIAIQGVHNEYWE